MRDDRGNWVIRFTRNIGRASSFIAELWALRADGLTICLARNFLVVEVEIVAKVIVDLFTNTSNSDLANSPLVDDCRHLTSQFLQNRIKHCFCETNRCTDSLARMGSQQSLEFILFDSPLVDIELHSDFNSLYLNRRCPEDVASI